jgi:hypothetical protein
MRYTVKERLEECPQAPWDSAFVFTVLADGEEFVQEFMDADAALDFAAQLNRQFAS